MFRYKDYQHLLKQPYLEGKQDCYGLMRQFYQDLYGIRLRNYARPAGFDQVGLPLIGQNFQREGFQVVEVSLQRLKQGDALLLAVLGAKVANHVAIYVGNNLFIHHLYDRVSCEDPLDQRWKNRVLTVVRHPDVTEHNRKTMPTVNLVDHLPAHVKHRLQIA